MSESKHKQDGRWFVLFSRTGANIGVWPDEETARKWLPEFLGARMFEVVEATALRVAAPELLAALTELNEALDDGLCNSGTPGFDSKRLGVAQDAARAAIARATGAA